MKMKKKKQRRNHTAAFKSKVAPEALAGRVSASAAGRRGGVHPNPICQWKKSPAENSHRLFEDSRPEKDGQTEIPNGKVDALTGEIEYLKGQTGQLSMHERKTMINRETKRPGVRRQCGLLPVCRRPPYCKPNGEPAILRFPDRQYPETPCCGEHRLPALLREKGWPCSRDCQFPPERQIDFSKANGIKISMNRTLYTIVTVTGPVGACRPNPCKTGNDLWHGIDNRFQFYSTERPHKTGIAVSR